MLQMPRGISKNYSMVALLLLSMATSRAEWTSGCPRDCRCTQNSEEHWGRNLASCTRVTSVPELGPETEVIKIKDGELGRIPEDAFRQNDLIYLSVRMSNVLEIEPGAFNGQKRLEHLLLSHNRIEKLDNRTFGQNRMLRTLGLNDNRIERVGGGLFSDNPSLEILDLSNNLIESVEPEAFKSNRRLYFLDLSGNNLTRLDAALLSEMPNLRILQLDGNSWHCDCRMAPFREWFVGKSVDLTHTRCQQPESLKDRPWSAIDSAEFVCS